VRLSKAELMGCRKVQIMLCGQTSAGLHATADPRALVAYIEVYINAKHRHKRKLAFRLKLYCGRGFANQNLATGVITGSVPL